MHLRHPGLTYSTFGAFTKKKNRVQETLVKFQEEEDSRYIYQNELDKACFQYDTDSGNFKYLTKRTASDKILLDEAFNIVKNRNMMNMNVDFLQWCITFLMKNPPCLHYQRS